MSYLRLFIELRNEDTGAACGQVRVELQDQPGRVDGKVRCSLMGLPAGQLYEMALVCEQGGHYKEYPVGQFGVNPRGQAGPMFRGSFPNEPRAIPVTEFKAVIARGSEGNRLVGFRWEPILIPWKYEKSSAVETENVYVNEEAPADLACTSKVEEPEILTCMEVVEENMILPEAASKQEEAEVAPAAFIEPEEVTEIAAAMDATDITETKVANDLFSPDAIFVLRDLSQVNLVCGDAGRHAFQRYRHLILAQQDQVNYFGIPCRFRPTQQMELAEEGYTLFYTPHGDEPGYGEFGYWMKRL